jgi:hypothetical protein
MTDEEHDAICWRNAQASFPKRKHGFRAHELSRYLKPNMSYLIVTAYLGSSRSFRVIDLAMRVLILIDAVKMGGIITYAQDENLFVSNVLNRFAKWIVMDPNTSTICLLHDLKQSSTDDEIVAFANSVVHHEKFVRFHPEIMSTLLIDFYHYLTNTDITDVNELSDETRLAFPGIFINPRTLNVCICYPRVDFEDDSYPYSWKFTALRATTVEDTPAEIPTATDVDLITVVDPLEITEAVAQLSIDEQVAIQGKASEVIVPPVISEVTVGAEFDYGGYTGQFIWPDLTVDPNFNASVVYGHFANDDTLPDILDIEMDEDQEPIGQATCEQFAYAQDAMLLDDVLTKKKKKKKDVDCLKVEDYVRLRQMYKDFAPSWEGCWFTGNEDQPAYLYEVTRRTRTRPWCNICKTYYTCEPEDCGNYAKHMQRHHPLAYNIIRLNKRGGLPNSEYNFEPVERNGDYIHFDRILFEEVCQCTFCTGPRVGRV